MKKIVLIAVMVCIGGVSSSFATDKSAENFSFDGRITGVSFQKMMSEKKEFVPAVSPLPEKKKEVLQVYPNIDKKKEFLQESNQEKTLRKVV